MKQRVVRVPEELVPFLEQALDSFPGPWLFPDETGAKAYALLRKALASDIDRLDEDCPNDEITAHHIGGTAYAGD